MNQRLASGQHRELAERAAGAGDADREAALLRREGARDDPEHHAEPGAGQAEADEQTRGKVEAERIGGMRHGEEAHAIGEPARDQHAPRTVAIGDRAGERHGASPHQVLQRDGEGERFAPPAEIHRHRPQEETEALPRAEREHQDQPATDENHRGRAPAHALVCIA
jgi:hypothetical protein